MLPLCSMQRKSLAFFVSNAYRTYPSEQNEWGTSRRRRVQNSSVLYIFRDFCRKSILHVYVKKANFAIIRYSEGFLCSVSTTLPVFRPLRPLSILNKEDWTDGREDALQKLNWNFERKRRLRRFCLGRHPSLPLRPSSWWSDGRRKINFQSWPRRFPLWANGYTRMDGRIDGMWSSEHHENMAESDQTFSHVLEPSFSTIHASRTSTENVRCLREMALLFHINR